MKSRSQIKRIAMTAPDKLTSHIFDLEAKLKIALSALEFYASARQEIGPCPDGNPGCCVLHYRQVPNWDHGEIARTALKEIE